jgi:hypothetical protein
VRTPIWGGEGEWSKGRKEEGNGLKQKGSVGGISKKGK